MNHQLGIPNARRALAFAFALIMAFALTASIAGSQAEAGKKKAKPVKVSVVSITTANQQQLVNKKKLTVKVKSTGKASPKLSVVSGGKSNHFKAVTVKFKKKGTKTVNLALTNSGKTALGKCGAKTVQVNANYKRKVGKKMKKAKASKKKTLAKWNANEDCINYVTVDLGDDPEHCDFLDQTVCLQPFPNDYYTVNDSSTPTGKRLNIGAQSTPVNTGNASPANLDVTDINRGDGFSPGNQIIIKIPGLDTPAAFDNTGLVPLEDISDYKRADQPVLLIDAETGERQAIWAELDSNPTSVDPTFGPDGPDPGSDPDVVNPGGINTNPTNTGPVNLLIRPAKNLEYGHRYIVAFRNLKDASNNAIAAPLGFRVYRDDLPTKQDIVEERRPHMESVIGDLVSKAGVDRSSLYMAWDFTVASQESITGRALKIRDDAFARLGDTNLADRKIDGDSPDVDVLAWCDASAPAAATCGNNYPGRTGADWNPNNPVTSPVPGADEQRTVAGYIRDVPCYLSSNNCAPGGTFTFDSNGELTWNESSTVDVPFLCTIPRSVVNTGTVIPGGSGVYGHGLLGLLNQVRSGGSTREVGNLNNSSWCGANWDGFSNLDIGIIFNSLQNMSNFNKAVDRMQQGFVNFMMIQRAMIHPDGFAAEPAFQMTHNGTDPVTNPGTPAIDVSAGEDTRGYYMGISQGGIMGGALTALSPDVDRGVLGVPGINYSLLLRRSVDSDEYFKAPGVGLYANYPDLASRPLLLSLMQLLWDRGEGNGYAEALTDNPLPNTNPHEVLLRVALGDHQVTNFAAEVEARTIGAKRYSPTLLPARTWDLDYEALPPVSTFPTSVGESIMVYYDGGPPSFEGTRDPGSGVPPLENVPPRPEWGFGSDPHGFPRHSADGKQHAADFLETGTIDACADPSGYCFSNGWDGSTGL
ncbi:MAG: hypothetical protein KDB52_05110 [Solirubrobacterales bacterium]|nr:hypothetical protein [Solirubrobacterales bacterium]